MDYCGCLSAQDRDSFRNPQLGQACTRHACIWQARVIDRSLSQGCVGIELQHRGVTLRHRAILVDWILDVAQEFALRSDTLFSAVDVLDRYLQRKDEATAWLQLLGCACIWTAAKIKEPFAPSAKDMVHLTADMYSTIELAQMERSILATLEDIVCRPTIHTFLSALLHAMSCEDRFGYPADLRDSGMTCVLCWWDQCERTWGSQQRARTFQPPQPEVEDNVLSRSAPLLSTFRCLRDNFLPISSVHSNEHASTHQHFANRTDLDSNGRQALLSWLSSQSCIGSSPTRDAFEPPSQWSAGHVTSVTNSLDKAHTQLTHLARLVAEACLLDHNLLRFSPAEVAAACVMVARSMLSRTPWSPGLAHVTGIDSPTELATCVVAVGDAYFCARQDNQLHSLRSRYSLRRMDVFSLEPSAETLQLVANCRAMAAYTTVSSSAAAAAAAAVPSQSQYAVGTDQCTSQPSSVADNNVPSDAASADYAMHCEPCADLAAANLAQQLSGCSLCPAFHTTGNAVTANVLSSASNLNFHQVPPQNDLALPTRSKLALEPDIGSSSMTSASSASELRTLAPLSYGSEASTSTSYMPFVPMRMSPQDVYGEAASGDVTPSQLLQHRVSFSRRN